VEKHSTPARDSWIQLAPGAKVTIDARLGAEWMSLTQHCREIRGGVLARAFEIEYLVDQVIAEAVVPSSGGNAEGRRLLDAFFLKGPGNNFGRKIDVLRKLRDHVPRLQGVLSQDLFPQLTTVRDVRNDFAHYPVTFVPVGEAPNQSLSPILVSRRGRFLLDEAFLREHEQTFSVVLTGLERAFGSLMQDEALAGPGR
jgi:hypothetical protein